MVQPIEAHIQDVINYLSQNPGAKVVQVAKQFGVPRNRLRFCLKGGKPKTELKPVNKKLSEPEEQAICNFIDCLDKINLVVRAEFVTDAANYVLKHWSSNSLLVEEIPTVDAQWTTRFLKCHDYFKQTQKKINSDRQASENLEQVNGYFNKLQTIIQEGGILPDDTYNMDETGFRIGMGKDQLIVTQRKWTHYFGLPENRESTTAIECISAAGEFLPLFLILSGTLHMAQ
jgi:site-specific DNA-cytosine methylase